MGEAKRRGTYEQRKAMAIAKKLAKAEIGPIRIDCPDGIITDPFILATALMMRPRKK